MRGEYRSFYGVGIIREELPPRARRIPLDTQVSEKPQGTTSACAENTFRSSVGGSDRGNYLRVRGEYLMMFSHAHLMPELPPRARRIHIITAPLI